MTHNLLGKGTASGGTNRVDKVRGIHIVPCIIDVTLPREQTTIAVVECERVDRPCLLRRPVEAGTQSKDGVVFGDVVSQAVMGAAHGGARLACLAEGLASGEMLLFVD